MPVQVVGHAVGAGVGDGVGTKGSLANKQFMPSFMPVASESETRVSDTVSAVRSIVEVSTR
jgi:hypothetical protein